MWCVGSFFALLWLALWSRAFYLQVVMGPDLAEMASRQHKTTTTITGIRGNITDRNGNILAQTVDAPSISANPSQIKNPDTTAQTLATILGKPVGPIKSILTSNKKFAWIARKLDPNVAQQIKDAKLDGIFIVQDYVRSYPYKTLAGQLLGFTGSEDNGLEGLEKAHDETLRGLTIRQEVQRDATGRRLSIDSVESEVNLRGKDLRLTIDTNVQYFAEESLQSNVENFEAKWGGCIVVDVPSGDILAWAQYPFFDPNAFRSSTPAKWRDRLATDALEQGSTIKSFLIAAALEEQVVAPDTLINCEKGKWKVGKAIIHDTHPYSILPVEKILHVSSNIGVAKIGIKLGANKYYSYLTRLGFGSRTGLPLVGESSGILRPSNRWQEIDLAATSFGQSFSATMLQMAQAYHTLANGGMKKILRIVADAPPEQEERIFSKATMAQLYSMLREVVEEPGGTGKQARIPGLVVGGKTGTAQKMDASKRYGAGRVGSFVGMLPIENPRYLILVLLDEPKKAQYGGIVATPVFRHVALNTMAYHGLLPDSEDPTVLEILQKKKPGTVATVAGSPATTAPRPAVRPNGASVAGIVPTLVGLGTRTAIEELAEHGVMPSFVGSGTYVVRQVPEGGVRWDEERHCTLWLEEQS